MEYCMKLTFVQTLEVSETLYTIKTWAFIFMLFPKYGGSLKFISKKNKTHILYIMCN